MMSDLPDVQERAHHGRNEEAQAAALNEASATLAGRGHEGRRDRGRNGVPPGGPPIASASLGDPDPESMLAAIERRIGTANYARYFREQTRVSLNGSRLEVVVPTGFIAELIRKKFGDAIARTAAEHKGAAASPSVHYRIDPSAFSSASAVEAANRADAAHAAMPAARGNGLSAKTRSRFVAGRVDAGLPVRHRLDDFIVGQANLLAHAAALRLVDDPSPRPASPLFIHGACGMGKTHLLQGLASAYREKHPEAMVVYTTAEEFTNECTSAMRGLKDALSMEAFRKKYRRVDLLCVDDVHFFSSKQKTQSELLHTFDELDLSGSRLALASDEHPRQVRDLSRALVSRFMSGLVVRLDAPDAALRERILIRAAEKRGLRLDPVAAKFVAQRGAERGTAASVRDLEGDLARIEAHARLEPGLAGEGGTIGLNIVRRALGADPSSGQPVVRRPVRGEEIVAGVCAMFRVDLAELMGRGRHPRVVLARSAAAWLARSMTTMSFPEIARVMGRPNHSTVVTACQRIGKQIEADEPMDLGRDRTIPELEKLSVREAVEQLRQEILRGVRPGA
jgi:chromosomal replication initiator protein